MPGVSSPPQKPSAAFSVEPPRPSAACVLCSLSFSIRSNRVYHPSQNNFSITPPSEACMGNVCFLCEKAAGTGLLFLSRKPDPIPLALQNRISHSVQPSLREGLPPRPYDFPGCALPMPPPAFHFLIGGAWPASVCQAVKASPLKHRLHGVYPCAAACSAETCRGLFIPLQLLVR